jgi:hypothetical protein
MKIRFLCLAATMLIAAAPAIAQNQANSSSQSQQVQQNTMPQGQGLAGAVRNEKKSVKHVARRYHHRHIAKASSHRRMANKATAGRMLGKTSQKPASNGSSAGMNKSETTGQAPQQEKKTNQQ